MNWRNLDREIDAADTRGYWLYRKGYGRPVGNSAITKIEQEGFDRALKEQEEATRQLEKEKKR